MLSDSTAQPRAEASFHCVRESPIRQYIPAKHRLGRHLVDILSARTARPDIRPVEFLIGNLNLRRNVKQDVPPAATTKSASHEYVIATNRAMKRSSLIPRP